MIESVADVSLAQYAGVVAAVADDVPLEAALSNERIEPAAWPSIDASWKEAIAGAGADGPLFTAFADKRAEAEDWLARSVRPLDDDLAAWMRFLSAYGKHPAPFELLARSGLRLPDLARLSRRWARRFAEDRDLEKRAAEIAQQPPAPLPPIAVGTFELKPFPWSPGAAVSDPGAAAPIDASRAAHDEELPLDRYAALCVELEQPKADRARVLAAHGLSPERFATVEAAWKARLAADPSLVRDFRQLHAYQRSRRAAAAKVVPRDPSAPPPSLTGTALALDRPLGLALPFSEGEAPAEVAAPSVAPKPRPAASLAGTALAVDVPRGPALPFGDRSTPPPSVVRPPVALAGTALALDTSPASTSALPFGEGDAPSEIAAPSNELKPKPSVAGTALAVDAPRGPALPFARDAAAKPDVALPTLTLEQYASLCIDLERGAEAEVLARYRLSRDERVALDEAFERRFKQAPAQRRTWERACETYRAWLAKQGRGG